MPYQVAVALLIAADAGLEPRSRRCATGSAPALADAAATSGWLNLVLVVMIALAAQLVLALPDRLLFGMLGVDGLAPSAPASSPAGGRVSRRATGPGSRPAVALVGGFFGGLSGIWGPPIVMYLVAHGLPKIEMVRAQSLSFLLGSLVLFARAPAFRGAERR